MRTFFIQFILLLITGSFVLVSALDVNDPIPALLDELSSEDMVQQSLIYQQLYEKSHFSVHTVEAVEALENSYKGLEHQELKGEAGAVLVEFHRQFGELEKIKPIILELGFISGWQVLGPLKIGDTVSAKDLKSKEPLSMEGLNRKVYETAIPSYGQEDFYSTGAGHFGYFNANLALFPNQLVSGHFRSWFYSDGKSPIRLGLGWHNKISVWINGNPLFSGNQEQIPHVDQKVVYFKIKKGWHQISLKTESSSDEMILGFFARMTNAGGKRIETSMQRRKSSRKKPVILNSEDYERSLLDMARKQGPRQLAGIMLQKEIVRLEETPKNLLLEAFQQNPDRWVTEKLLQLEKNPNNRWSYLTGFLKANPDDPWGFSQKGRISLSQSRFWEARDYAERAFKINPEYWPGQLLEYNALTQMNLQGEALKKTEELIAAVGDIPWVLMDLCDLYDEMGMDSKMDEVLLKTRELRHSSKKFNQRRLRFLKEQKETEKLGEFFQELIDESPGDMSMFLKYMVFLTSNGQELKAERMLLEKTRVFPENPFLLEELGNVQMELQKKSSALAQFKKALKIEPQNPELEKIIQMYHSEEQAFFTPYRIEKPDTTMMPEDGILVNLHNRVRKISASGQASIFHQIEYEVMGEKGVKELMGHSFSYAPLRQRAEVLKAEIHRADETIILSRFSRARLSNPAYRTYYDLLAFQIPFPTLKVGDRVLLEYRIDDIGPNNIYGSYYGDVTYFVESYPALVIKYTLILPPDLPFNYSVNHMNPVYKKTETEEGSVHEWALSNIPIVETEPLMPPPQSNMAYLSYSSFSSWNEMAEWYHHLIKDQLILDPETKKIVADLKSGVTDRRETVKRIHEFVITHTRYVALEFGIHGYKPYQVNRVCNRQFGDCKDKASLMVAMLREAGIEASIAIVRTSDRGEVSTDPANLSYFNHAITYVPEFDLFLDGTAEYSGIDELPEMDQGAQTLVVDAEGHGVLMKIPTSNAEDNLRLRSLDININQSGQAEISGSMQFHGVHAPSIRRFFEGEGDLQEPVTQILSYSFPGFELKEVHRGSFDLNQPIEVEFAGRANRILLEKREGGHVLPLNFLAGELLPALAPTSDREFPLQLGLLKETRTSITVECQGKTIEKFPENLTIDDELIWIDIQFKQEGSNRLAISYEVEFKAMIISPEEYTEFRANLRRHDKLLDQTVVLK